MNYHAQKAAIVRQYMIEPIACRTLTEEERVNHIIAEIQTLNARECGFSSFEDMKRALMPETTVSVVEHSRVQGERRVR